MSRLINPAVSKKEHRLSLARREWLAPVLLIGGLLLVHVVFNSYWLAANVTTTGADKSRHLARSIEYHQLLTPFTLRGLFAALIENPIRPSLVPLSATLAYRILGVSVDAGPMINILYLAILMAATYGLGLKLAGRKVGLLAAFLIGTYPMIFAMSRYFYLELGLTAMVAATIYFLVASDGFRSRRFSLFFGLCLGLGLLTKRTFVAFATLPILYVIVRSESLQDLWRQLTNRPHVHWRALLGALVGGALLAGLWYVPNRETIATLILGNWLFPAWWFLAALTLYLLALPSSPAANMLGSLSLAASIASVWYLARLEFLVRAAGFAYSDLNASGRNFDWLDPGTYYYYALRLVLQHVSAFYFIFAVIAVGILLVLWWRKRPKLKTSWWVLAGWFVGGYAVLTFTLYRQSRAVLPLLPPIALLTAAGLLRLGRRRLRTALLTVMLVGGLLQWVVLSYTPFHGVAEALTVKPIRLFAWGGHVVWPDYGSMDPGWAVHDDLLQQMDAARREQGRTEMRLGLLANATQLNAPQFQPFIAAQYPGLVVDSLNRAAERGEPAYPLLFAYDFVAVKAHNDTVSAQDQAIIDQLLEDPPQAFTQAFELMKTYALPDGDILYLYEQRYTLPPDLEPGYVADLSSYLATIGQEGDAIYLDTPGMLAPLARQIADTATFYLAPSSAEVLSRMGERHRRIFVVGRGAASPDSSWLDQHAYSAGSDWFGDIHLATYGTALAMKKHASGACFESLFDLEQYALPDGPWSPGDVVPFSLVWRAEQKPSERYKIFAHLLAADGQLVAQYDGEPVGNSRPTNEWLAGDVIEDRRGVLLPPSLTAGTYTLAIGWYPLDGGERLAVQAPQGQDLGTEVILGIVEVSVP